METIQDFEDMLALLSKHSVWEGGRPRPPKRKRNPIAQVPPIAYLVE